MKAILVPEPRPIDAQDALIDGDVAEPDRPTGHDLLVQVAAISVNPLDTKQRMIRAGAGPRILGWDAAGTVEAVGDAVTLFRPGDRVYYAGSVRRPGSCAQKQLVDERIVGRMPESCEFASAAALPLTSITAYEALVDRLGIDPEGASRGRSLLIIGAAGGVGSMAIQIGRRLGLEVIATASREQSVNWCFQLGAHRVIDHVRPLREQLAAGGPGEVDYVFNCADTDRYWTQMVDVVRPQGSLCSVVANREPLDLKLLMPKCVRFTWEAMFARSNFATADMIEQHRLLCRVAEWVDAGTVRTTLTSRLAPICAATLVEAHRRIESRTTIGKIVLEGW